MELKDLFHRFPQRKIIMLHYTLEADRGKICETSSGVYKTDFSFSKSFLKCYLKNYSIHLSIRPATSWWSKRDYRHAGTLLRKTVSSLETKHLKKWWKYCSVCIHADFGMKANVKQDKPEA